MARIIDLMILRTAALFAIHRVPRAGLVAALSALLLVNLFGRSSTPENPDAAPLTADEVVERLVRMNDYRAEALRNYTSERKYHLELNGIVHKSADMVAKMSFQWPDRKEFTILSASGSEIMQKRVLKALLEAEKESMLAENRERTALNPQNYQFTLAGVEGSPHPAFYVLRASPRVKNKFLFKGTVWVDARDFAVARIEGEPAKNPSWWTKKIDIKYSYQKLGNFWLPAHIDNVTEVRIFGRSVLTVEFQNYNLIETRKLPAELQTQNSRLPLATPVIIPSR
jgi:hypothetical protein